MSDGVNALCRVPCFGSKVQPFFPGGCIALSLCDTACTCCWSYPERRTGPKKPHSACPHSPQLGSFYEGLRVVLLARSCFFSFSRSSLFVGVPLVSSLLSGCCGLPSASWQAKPSPPLWPRKRGGLVVGFGLASAVTAAQGARWLRRGKEKRTRKAEKRMLLRLCFATGCPRRCLFYD